MTLITNNCALLNVLYGEELGILLNEIVFFTDKPCKPAGETVSSARSISSVEVCPYKN